MNPSPTAITTALHHHQAGRVAEAEQVYKLLLHDQPDLVDALNLLGALVYEDSRYDEALGYFERVLTLKPGADSHNSMGIVLKAQGKLDGAIAHYREAMALKPDQPEILSNFGNVLKDRGDLEEARAMYQRAIALRPNYAEAHNNLGIVYKEQDKLAEAAQCYRQALLLKPNYAEAYNNLGIVLRVQGDLDEAVQHFQQAIALKPNYPDAYTNLASVYQQQGNMDEAIAQYNKLLEFKPNNAEAFNSVGLALQHQGNVEAAIAAYRQALAHKPIYPAVCNNLGNLLLESNRPDDAIAYYKQAIEQRPAYAEAMNNLGNALQRQGKLDEAVAHYQKALEIKPDFVEALSNLGAVYKDQKRLEDAISYLERAIALRDNIPEIHNNLGNVYQEQGKVEQAIACYQRSVDINPQLAEVQSNLGNMFQYLGKFPEAFEHFERAIAAQPEFSGAYNNLGIAYRNYGQLQKAFDAYDQAIALKPDFVEAHWNKALNQLLIGDFVQGFAGYEKRFEWGKFRDQNPQRPFTQPRWDGSNLNGKTILLHAEQGMGDTIQFIRYAAILAQQGGRILLECHPPLINLLKTIPHLAQIIAYNDPIPAFDVHAPLMSLPHILGTTLDTVPADIPYLLVPASNAQLPSPSVPHPSPLKVGFVWSGNPQNPYNRSRTIPLAVMLRLADISGVQLYSLQKDLSADEAALLAAHPDVQDLRSQLNDFTDTAALIHQLDLVISIDSAITHLAGALGKPVWLLLPSASDWRWMLDRPDTPWYPTLRLFRQPTFGDWDTVLASVQTELRQLIDPMPHETATGKRAKRKAKKQNAIQPSKPKTQPSKSASPPLRSSPAPASPTPQTKPSLPEELKTAVRLHQAGNLAEARRVCLELVERSPIADGWHLLGIIAHQERQFEQAIAHYRKTLELDPNHYDTWNNLAVAFHEQGNLEQAIAHYEKVLALKPDYADAHNNYANALRDRGRLDDAIQHYQQAIAANSSYAEAYNNLGLAYYAKNDFEQAATAYRQAIAQRHNFPQAHNHLGNALKELGNFPAAAQSYQQAIALKPDYAKAFNNWGNVFRDDGDLQTAVQYYDQATAIESNFAEAHWNKALTLLLGGDFLRGFAEYEWRRQVNLPSFKSLREFPGPRWDGSPLNGQIILLHAEQGMGDIIQFVRYVPLVIQRGGRVILECHPPLINLLKTFPLEAIVPYNTAPPGYHVQAPLMSLPHILGTTLETVPATVPYLAVETAVALPVVAQEAQGTGENHPVKPPASDTLPPSPFKIGIVWSGNPDNPYNRSRAVPLEKLLTLTDLLNVQFYSLQKDLLPGDAEQLQAHPMVQDLRSQLNDFTDTAALITQLDLVISIDSAVTHLAGALGKPVWLLLPHAPDWRWMLHRDDSPWYPTLRIFRQPIPGAWEPVLEQIRQALFLFTAPSSAPTPSTSPATSSTSPTPSTSPAASPALSASPTFPTQPARLSGALQLYHSGDLAAAEQIYRDILQLHPNEPEALNVLSVILLQTKRFAEGITLLRQLLDLQPNFAEGWSNLGGGLQEQRQYADAIACYESAIALNPNYADAHQNLSIALLELDRPDDAVTHAERVVRLKPKSAEAHYNLGLALRRAGRVPEAIATYRRTIQLQPDRIDAHKNLGHALLLSGDFANGFREYAWRWRQAHWTPRPFTQPEWDGTDLQGKPILLHAEQGFGDTIQFVRYAALVKARGGRVIVECQPALIRLLSTAADIDQLVPQDTPLPPFEVHAPLLSLPGILGTTPDTIPAAIPYLTIQNSTVPLPSALTSHPSPLKIGIVWAGNPNHKNDRARSCALDRFRPLIDLSGTAFYSLQLGEPLRQLHADPALPIQDLSPHLHDFADTASAIAQLDLIITVDTAVAHLAGALGKPVWLLLAFAPDWRWMLERTDTPWYPAMRLFRQPRPGDWKSVFTQLTDALRSQLSTIPPVSSPSSLSSLAPLDSTTDWGIFTTYFALHLRHHPKFAPLPLASTDLDTLHPLHRAVLKSWENRPALNPHGVTWQIVGDRWLPLTIDASQSAAPAGENTIALVALEETQWDAVALARAQSYRAIVTGSTWATERLKAYGLNPIQSAFWGIDPAWFTPQPKTTLFNGSRFVVFSGGVFSFAKGQDILIAAFKAFQARHPEALLLTAWSAPSANTTAEIAAVAQSTHLSQPPTLHPDGSLHTRDWLIANGLPPDSFIELGAIPYWQLGQVLQAVDVAVFPSRCEPGANQTLIASLACAVPTILSNNTAHLDLTRHNLGYPLYSQRPVIAPSARQGIDGWGESDVEELLEILEHLYTQATSHRSIAAADFLREWSWDQQLARLLANLSL